MVRTAIFNFYNSMVMRKMVLLLLSIASFMHEVHALPNFDDATDRAVHPSQKVYPNPASNYVVFEVDLAAEPKGCFILIQDIAGRVLKQLIVSAKEQQLVLDSREFAPGTYSVLLQNHGATLQTKKLVIRQ